MRTDRLPVARRQRVATKEAARTVMAAGPENEEANEDGEFS